MLFLASSKVAIIHNSDRRYATRKVVEELGLPDTTDHHVLVKPNLNTADPAPGSTHNDTLRTLVELIKEQRPDRITVGDRSGPVKTRMVFEEKGIFKMSRDLGFECLVLDEKPLSEWVKFNPPDCHWRDGFWFSKAPAEVDATIGLCCLKTHMYGGHFTMSLKLAVGLAHRTNMTELHSSIKRQREMIAELNLAYSPSLVIMDGVEAFYRGGPMKGPRWTSNLTLASMDRVALDAVGVAALKIHGTTKRIERKRIFEQDQIRRAAELDIGVKSPREIEIVPVDVSSESICDSLQKKLDD